MPVADTVAGEVAGVAANPENPKSNRELAIELRAQGLSTPEIGRRLGISHQGVQKLLKTAQLASLPAARMEAASRTLAELAEATRQSAAEVFQMGIDRAKRRMREVGDSGDDHAAKTVLETAKLSVDGARIVHGWADTNGATAGGRIAVGVITDLRGLKSAQVVDVEPIPITGEQPNDSSNPSKLPESARNEANLG